MIITTTSVLSGKEVAEYHGLVSGAARMNSLYARPKRPPCARWKRRPGANAVIGVDLDYENVTAVTVR